jgi:hypothetical protein
METVMAAATPALMTYGTTSTGGSKMDVSFKKYLCVFRFFVRLF